ncbi:hypothetical protein [Neisseria musculi]|nr:hypothetical protein [Neisseria musculi]
MDSHLSDTRRQTAGRANVTEPVALLSGGLPEPHPKPECSNAARSRHTL